MLVSLDGLFESPFLPRLLVFSTVLPSCGKSIVPAVSSLSSSSVLYGLPLGPPSSPRRIRNDKLPNRLPKIPAHPPLPLLPLRIHLLGITLHLRGIQMRHLGLLERRPHGQLALVRRQLRQRLLEPRLHGGREGELVDTGCGRGGVEDGGERRDG